MKKYFAKAFLGLCALGVSTVAFAQQAATAAADAAAPAASDTGLYQAIKTKFIEGGANFMSSSAIVFIFGLAFCLERIIYLNLAETNSTKLLKGIEDAQVIDERSGLPKVRQHSQPDQADRLTADAISNHEQVLIRGGDALGQQLRKLTRRTLPGFRRRPITGRHSVLRIFRNRRLQIGFQLSRGHSLQDHVT